MAFYNCPECKSINVSNFPLNVDEHGNPTDGTYAGSCNTCGYEEEYEYVEQGGFYRIVIEDDEF